MTRRGIILRSSVVQRHPISASERALGPQRGLEALNVLHASGWGFSYAEPGGRAAGRP